MLKEIRDWSKINLLYERIIIHDDMTENKIIETKI